MAVHMEVFETKEQWLEHRKGKIGGSDAGCILGVNKWKDNVTLWKEKTGLIVPEDISDKPAVLYGTKAEPILRDLFALDHQNLNVCYEEFNSWRNDRFPFAYVSLDGWCYDEKDRLGTIEIKTSTIRSKQQMKQWESRLPDAYYAQVLHEMFVVEADFGWLTALLRWEHSDGQYEETIRQYYIDRNSVEDDIYWLSKKEKEFYGYIESKTEPPKALPQV